MIITFGHMGNIGEYCNIGKYWDYDLYVSVCVNTITAKL